jgi:hypothetical protein
MTTTDVGRALGMSGEYVRGEIRDGRLKANALIRAGKRTVYRITPSQFEEYKARHWRPDVSRGTISQNNQHSQ